MRVRRAVLIAMSVRARNEALRALGLPLPGFVERGRTIASLPWPSLSTLAAHTPECRDVEYRALDELGDLDAVCDAIDAGEFDVVALSSFSARILETYALADRLRERGHTVVLGGLQVPARGADLLLDGFHQVMRDLYNPETAARRRAHRRECVRAKRDTA